VLDVTVNPVAQTATVTFDPSVTSVDELATWVRECGFHCRGESVPDHLCAMPASAAATGVRSTAGAGKTHSVPAVDATTAHDGHAAPPQGHMTMAGSNAASVGAPAAGAGPGPTGSPAEVMGHGGHGEMSMAGMVRDMRNRFVVAVVFGIVITLWSRIGRDVLGFTVAAPFGLRDDVFQLLLSLDPPSR